MQKTLRLFSGLALVLLLTANLYAQNAPKNWKNEDLAKDKVYGTSSDKALESLKGKPSVTVIVAVEDGGVDINHPDLKGQIWVNKGEIPNNKIDDDHNGYVDDVNGWNFIGGPTGDVNQDNLEITRVYRDLKAKYASADPSKISAADMPEYQKYLKIKKEFESKQMEAQTQYNFIKVFADNFKKLQDEIGKKNITQADLDNYKPTDPILIQVKSSLTKVLATGMTSDDLQKQIDEGLKEVGSEVNYQYNLDFNPRNIVGDNYTDATERYYGNNDVEGPSADHGTHVSGIIAGIRGNNLGSDGIADNVKILVVRAVPDGDERDKDVANGIRYAVDNGAKIISMSFGKGYAYNKQTVDDAVRYAVAHDVLLIHAAGNDAKDNDTTDNFPNPIYADTHEKAATWIEVGASDKDGNPASFSNYGEKSVDLFSPGVSIYSSIPDTAYAFFDGTSMAAPAVSGVAAIIREYFPKLTAVQVKDILMRSVVKIKQRVPMPGNGDKKVKFTKLCVTGGIINAYKAVQLAKDVASGKSSSSSSNKFNFISQF